MARRRKSQGTAKTENSKNAIIIAVIVVTLLIGVFALFQVLNRSKGEKTADNAQQDTQQQDTQANEEKDEKDKLPEYVDGSITLNRKAPQGITYARSYRNCYYKLGNTFSKLFPEDKLEAAMASLVKTKNGEEPDVMVLAALLEYFGIEKAEFEAAIETERAYCQKYGLDTTNEDYELPNADIIYTFDEEIIKHYYRRS